MLGEFDTGFFCTSLLVRNVGSQPYTVYASQIYCPGIVSYADFDGTWTICDAFVEADLNEHSLEDTLAECYERFKTVEETVRDNSQTGYASFMTSFDHGRYRDRDSGA